MGFLTRWFTFAIGLLFLSLCVWMLGGDVPSDDPEMPRVGVLVSLGMILMAIAFEVDSRIEKAGPPDGGAAEMTVTRSRLCLTLFAVTLVLFCLGFATMLALGDWWEFHRGLPQGPVALLSFLGCGYFAAKMFTQCLRPEISIVLSSEGITDQATAKGLMAWADISYAEEMRGRHILLRLANQGPKPSLSARLWQLLFGSKSKVALNLFGANARAATLLPIINSEIKKRNPAGGQA